MNIRRAKFIQNAKSIAIVIFSLSSLMFAFMSMHILVDSQSCRANWEDSGIEWRYDNSGCKLKVGVYWVPSKLVKFNLYSE